MKTYSKKISLQFALSVIVLLITFLKPSIASAQDYSKVAGIYQVYQNNQPLLIEGMNMYYVLNKNGIILLAMGRSTGTALSDVSGGISSGRISTGKFTMSSNSIIMTMKNAATSTYWTYYSVDKTIVKDTLKLKFIESL